MQPAADPLPSFVPSPLIEQERLEIWEALVRGTWSLLACDEVDERRLVLTRRNGPQGSAGFPLTVSEQRAALLAVLGHANKQISFELDVAVSTAWMLVTSAMQKLGIRSRVELIEIFGSLATGLQTPRVPTIAAHGFEIGGDLYVLFEIPLRRLEPPSCLTEAEREVVRGVLARKSNAEIARARGTSVHTVANQLRAIYVKLGISGRSQLLASC